MNTPFGPSEEQRDELVEQVAREIELLGMTGPAVHFLEASRPYRALGANAMLFFDPVLRGVFGGELASWPMTRGSSSSSPAWKNRTTTSPPGTPDPACRAAAPRRDDPGTRWRMTRSVTGTLTG
jgi:hypothetical protein